MNGIHRSGTAGESTIELDLQLQGETIALLTKLNILMTEAIKTIREDVDHINKRFEELENNSYSFPDPLNENKFTKMNAKL